jgi:hypothetical protein
VVSQFPIPLDALNFQKYLKNQIQHFSPSHYAQRKLEGKQKKIDKLSYGMRKINVKAKIIEIPPAKLVFTQYGNKA